MTKFDTKLSLVKLGMAVKQAVNMQEIPMCLILEEHQWQYDAERCGTKCSWIDVCLLVKAKEDNHVSMR